MYIADHYISRNKLLNGYQLAKLHTFEAAARHGSFAMAADELSLSPSAVSHRISALEEELGFQLFERFHRKVVLTAEGQRVFWALKSSLEFINQEILEIRNQELSGTLTIYSRPSIAQCWLVPRLADFSRLHPQIELNIVTGNENINLHGYGIDLTLYFDEKVPERLAIHYLMDEYIVPVCSPEYAMQHNLLENPSNLQNCRLLHDRQAWGYDSDGDEWESWARHHGVSLAECRLNMGFDRSDLAIIAAMNHGGIAMGRKNLVSKRLARNELVTPFSDREVKCEQRYYIATLPNRQCPKIQAFIEWAQQMAQETASA
ncbi:DNA-binding transcriptional regulator DsdC [Aeromonas jandaei]|uniref:DNA-binding transcriptional regulator DsdC n=1 Tax=Aeromonas jandaei TaxID=650 RepID=UPI001EEEF619|nr:DNA-binding transcriptional regulator DsdC [Aeromonas jandaei]MCF7718400.1 DNA-binding transcriptional regulator DsdC [Aeromonas jandaei]